MLRYFQPFLALAFAIVGPASRPSSSKAAAETGHLATKRRDRGVRMSVADHRMSRPLESWVERLH